MSSRRTWGKVIYDWIRDLHLYFGLFAAPFVLIFAISTIVFNHRLESEPERSTSSQQVRLESGLKDREQAKRLMQELNISGDLGGARTLPNQNRFFFGVGRPRDNVRVEVDLTTQTAEIQRNDRGLLGAMMYLHIQPGRHRPRSMIEWVTGKIWGVVTDTIVYTLLFLSISGIYLWAMLKAERKVGAVMIGAGGVTFLLILIGLISL